MLLLYTFCLLGLTRFFLILCPFRYVAARLSAGMAESPAGEAKDPDYVRRVVWTIGIVSKNTPWESKCLVQAIVGKMLLRRRHIHNILFLGVAKDTEHKMIAHAWLQTGDSIVIGGHEKNKFTTVAVFEDH